jgi:hypothetical protein
MIEETVVAPVPKPTKLKRLTAPTIRGKELDQDDFELLTQMWLMPILIQAADGAALANARYFLYRNGAIPRVQRQFLVRLRDKWVKQLEVQS